MWAGSGDPRPTLAEEGGGEAGGLGDLGMFTAPRIGSKIETEHWEPRVTAAHHMVHTHQRGGTRNAEAGSGYANRVIMRDTIDLHAIHIPGPIKGKEIQR